MACSPRKGNGGEGSLELLDRRLLLCEQAGIGTIVVACDVPCAGFDQQMLERVVVSLQDLGQRCTNHGVRAAIEFQASAAFGNNVKSLAMLLQDIGQPSLGICFDAFHYHTGCSKPSDLQMLTPANLFHVQLCDIADLPRELAIDSGRILPGEGDIDFKPLLQHLTKISYQGCVALELLNPQLWLVPPLQMGEIGITSATIAGSVDVTSFTAASTPETYSTPPGCTPFIQTYSSGDLSWE